MLFDFLKKKRDKKLFGNFGEEWIDYKEYLIKNEDEKVFLQKIELYRNKFCMAHEKGRMINTLDFVTYVGLFSELFNYYNNDICIDVAKFLTMKESTANYNFRVIMSLVDSLSTKMYIPTGVYRLHDVLEPASRKVRTTFTETEPMQI